MKASEFYEYLYGEKPPKNFTNSSSIHIFGFAEAYVEYLNQGQTLPIDSVSKSVAKQYAEFCVRCDRDKLPLLELDDYIKQYCC